MKETAITLQQASDRLRILAVALKSGNMIEADLPECGNMIEEIIIDSITPAIDAIKKEG